MSRRKAPLTSSLHRVVFWSAMVFGTLAALAALAALVDPVTAFGGYGHGERPHGGANASSAVLAQFALGKVLDDAAPAFGVYEDVQSKTSTW
jgi:hypothetical protein